MPFDVDRSARDESTEAWRALLGARRAARELSDGEPGLPPVGAPGRAARPAIAIPPDTLFAPLLHSDPARPFVVAQLGQSLDGRIADGLGESRYINGRRGLTHLHRLRALVDAVVIGASTAIADDPGLDVRHVEGDNPARVVIDRRGRVPPTLRLFRADGARRVVVVGAGARVAHAPGVEVLRVREDADGFAPADLVAALHAAGLRRQLIEGGAETVSRFIDAGALDRLHLIVAPVLLGDGPTGFSLKRPRRLSDCDRPPTRIYALGGDVLFDCDFSDAGSAGQRQQVEMADPQVE
ncbi:RibD family protein [Ancylobacter lacus]|uniref:RibD family protein n=1 Tax=Ancylobacter lacus TaxID=2579970 RepID=UPI001BD0023A|nr:RibD family protein [Ancylobacter lacus]MBS7539192.1 RibD family protein [Ancylobacter lacus]